MHQRLRPIESLDFADASGVGIQLRQRGYDGCGTQVEGVLLLGERGDQLITVADLDEHDRSSALVATALGWP
ncbi:hypothetical protein AB0883_18150 [Micromonospora sp. NPDC047812]|uniref:hypothetical protein n=1 Tax=Micromonospora sp. NPDC047812 TaxID=3155742 RepID=UPI003451BB52